MHLEAIIVRVWRYALGGRNLASLEIHLEAVIKRVWRCTRRPWSSEIGGVLGGGQSGGGRSGGRRDGSWDSIHWSTHNCGNVESGLQHGLPQDERLAGSGRQSILGVCSMGCMQYSVYAVLGDDSWSWHGKTESNNLTSCFQVIVELRTRQREMRGYVGNHHEKLGLIRISCPSQVTIPDTAGTSPDLVWNTTNTRSSQHNWPSRTPDLSYPLASSMSFPSSFPICLFPVLNSTITSNTKMSHRSLSLHAMIKSEHQVQHIQGTAYTAYSIHRIQRSTKYNIHSVQHPPKIVCLPFILMIPSWPLKVTSAFRVPPYMIDRHQPALQDISNVNSHCHIPTVASKLTEQNSLTTWRTIHWLPLSIRPNSLNHGIQVRTILASKCITKLARLGPLNSLAHGLQVYLPTRMIMASKCIPKLARLRPLNRLDHRLQLYHQTCTIPASMFTQLWPPCAYLQTRSITASKCISIVARLWPSSASPKSLNYSLQVHL